ncbi:MAG: hypothetical protein JXR41_03035 [Bacteroidales bacterium]|nr:hypothetical protein [Bacteroidales bacterium]MBN2762041.1 hypothetical protein [Bacteroidales bacterium]
MQTFFRKIGMITIGIAVSYFTTAQEFRKFSGKTETFIDELTVFMQPNISTQDEAILQAFISVWRIDSLFTVEEQSEIVKISVLLLEKKAKPSPHFSKYLECLTHFKRNNQTVENFHNWIKGINLLAVERKTTLSSLNRVLQFTQQLIDSSFLNKSATVLWKSSNPEYRIKVNETLAVIIGKTTLTCKTRFDSIQILETQGIYFPVENLWKGYDGRITWERAGFNSDEVFAQLQEYEIDMSKADYQAENVTFINKLYFNQPLTGVLTDKVKHNRTPSDADFPKFDSYQKDFSIKNLYKDINYEGGLSMQGARLIGTGTPDKLATVYIFRKDTLVIKAMSNYFAFKADRINSSSTSIVISLKTDSIYHPGLAFSYMVPIRELTLFQTDNFISKSPYYNSYHNVDMTFEQLIWKMDQPYMRFTPSMGSSIGIAHFESVNFFDNNKYLSIQGMDEVHPLVSIRSFARYIGMEEFRADDFANYLRKPLSQVKQLLMRMASMGFVFYDVNTDMAIVKPRLHDYLAASIAKIDYDVLGFPSRIEAPLENAIFDLRNYDLTINGIPRIFVSDSQNVVIYPAKDRIILKKDRDFQFSGTVAAGLLTFYGQNFFFNYDTFKIRLQKIDSLYIRYLTGNVDNYGLPVVDDVNNLIENITGDLFIDKPDNKSGRSYYPEYPTFISRESSYVYYDRPDIQNGTYRHEDFYFEIYPFTMDSLDNFNRQAMVFDGEFESAGIFPEIKESLRIQPDKSLGFDHTTQAEGLPLYGGKGNFINNIQLTNNGLRGKGTVEYLSSVTYSDNIIFYPDSMNAHAHEYTIAERTTGTEYPMVNSKNNYIHWMPYQDEMNIFKKDADFALINDSTSLAGNLKLKPSGLTGTGKIDLKNSDLTSGSFSFKSKEILADTADFYLKSVHTDGFTVLTDNVNAKIDFRTKTGHFNANEDFTMVTFPENKYISYLDYFVWDMNKKELAMGSNKTFSQPEASDDEEFLGPRYVSIDPGQDSLNFISPLAHYDYEHNMIKASQVKYIDVADSRIYPDEETLVVKPDALLKPLEKARLMVNRYTRFHELYNGDITIQSRNAYAGSADYDYVDELDRKQVIHFRTVQAEPEKATIARGEIIEADDFTLSPVFQYQGKVTLFADNKYLTFDGACLIETNCDDLPIKWARFSSEIDPFNIYIPLADPLIDVDRNKIFNGIYVSYDSIHLYPAFMAMRKNYSDKAIVTAGDFLYYDKNTQQYKIASKEKLSNPGIPGNYVSLHRETCELYGEGRMDIGAKLGQVQHTTVGNGRYNITENKVALDVILALDFYIDPITIDLMAAEIDSIPDLPATDLNGLTYTKGLVELIGQEKFDELRTEISLFGSVKEVPPELKHTIMFNELKLLWHDESNSYQSVGKIGIASINNTQINKRVDGLIEIQLKRSGDICDIYLQMNRQTWYYFGYTRGVMQIHSSNQAFLDRMKAMKPKERRLKVKSGESYIYMVSTDMKKNTFVRKYRNISEGEEQENP